jgi:Flp pilus assembly protein TadG
MRPQPPIQLDRARRERGQIIVIFALALVAIIGMVGLVIDGGGAFAQRRDEQKVADLAAVAGANAYMNAGTGATAATRTSAAIAGAQAAASRNGYAHGAGGASVAVTVDLLSSGGRVRVGLTAPHQNSFARVMGMNSWNVSVSAAADAGLVDTGYGAAPWTMNIGAFNADGSPKYTSSNPQDFGDANGDFPISPTDIAWTDFNGSNNVNTNEVRGIINGSNVVTETITEGQYIGQHNQGNHTALYSDVDQYLSGHDVPVPVVGPGDPNCNAPEQAHQDGCFLGWAMFHVISADGASSKTIRGYFLGDFISQPLSVGQCTAAMQAAGTCGLIDTASPFGAYIVRLSE